MKSISEAKWEVYINKAKEGEQYYWQATPNEDTGVSIIRGELEHSKDRAKYFGNYFAKLNNIKNWKWV